MIRHKDGYIEYEVGDKVRLRKYEGGSLPRGNNDSKISFMDGETVYEIETVKKTYSDAWKQDIKLKDVGGSVRPGHSYKQWTYSEGWVIPAEMDMTQHVIDVLKGNVIPILPQEQWETEVWEV